MAVSAGISSAIHKDETSSKVTNVTTREVPTELENACPPYSSPEGGLEVEVDGEPIESKSTWVDLNDMKRMGKKQQLIRNFRLVSTMSFVAMCTAIWELGLFTVNQGLIDGGRPGLIYSTIWNFVAFGPVYLSMAEMASMAPIAGAQYHWVSEFAPEKYQKILSYISGWASAIAMQGGNAIGVFLTGTLIQVIILVNDAKYAFPNWQGTLLVIATTLITYAANVYGAKILPKAQNLACICHIVLFFCLIVPIWVNAPRATSKQVFTEFSNTGGWSNMPFALLVGQLTGIYCQLGVDTGTHISEEVADASKAVPISMMVVYVVNFVFIVPAFITLCYAMPDLNAALNDESGYPLVHVMRASMSDTWVTVLLALIVFILTCANISYLTAVTRDLFAFARDDGLPFSSWISKIHKTRRIPQNAIVLTSVLSVLLSFIYIGSPVAFYAITSLFTVAILQCYTLSIGCMLWRRLKYPQSLPPAQFPLGRWGPPLNGAAVIYCIWSFFWCFWPISTPTTASGFNWASVIYISVLIIALIYYLVKARHVYEGPVVLVEGRKPLAQ